MVKEGKLRPLQKKKPKCKHKYKVEFRGEGKGGQIIEIAEDGTPAHPRERPPGWSKAHP